MLKAVCTFSCLCLFAFAVAAQKPAVEPGLPRELKGIVKIHVAADTESARKNIIAAIKHSLPALVITDNTQEADVWLVFRTDRRNFPKALPASGLISSTTAPTAEEYEVVGSGEVLKPVTKDTVRRLVTFKDVSGSTTADNLSKEFAGAFIKSYRKAN